ncbi:MAG: hypothetical protein WAM94_10825 [Chromatiaceae bacterium]
MSKDSETNPKQPNAGLDLADAVQLLAEELRATRAEARRQRRRLGAMALALGLLVGALGWSLIPAYSLAETSRPPQQSSSPMAPEERAAHRAQLLAMLPADKQHQLESFEREVAWLTGYMQTWDQGQAGAVVAMMLFKMGQSMSTMPSMEQQMRTMSGQMGALPAIVAELAQINAKMHVITASMDSTMGRAGRMMPWMPFSP